MSLKNVFLSVLPYLIAGGTSAALLAEKNPNPIVAMIGLFAAGALAHYNLRQPSSVGKTDEAVVK